MATFRVTLAEGEELIEYDFEALNLRDAHQHVKNIVHDEDFEVMEIVELD